jgi:mannonate dehydratase
MKLGLGLYRALLTEDNFKFARQAGATHLVVHLVDYFRGADPSLARGADLEAGWGVTTDHDKLWDYDELAAIKRSINRQGLV